MKKTAILSVLCCSVLLGACAGAGTASAPTSANTPMTLDEALQKSAETRQKLLDAKKAYEEAKTASENAQKNNTSVTSELAKQAVQNKVDQTKQKIEAEKQAWKEVLK